MHIFSFSVNIAAIRLLIIFSNIGRETRDGSKKNVLDCTHWCAPVFDVFEDTLLFALTKFIAANKLVGPDLR